MIFSLPHNWFFDTLGFGIDFIQLHSILNSGTEIFLVMSQMSVGDKFVKHFKYMSCSLLRVGFFGCFGGLCLGIFDLLGISFCTLRFGTGKSYILLASRWICLTASHFNLILLYFFAVFSSINCNIKYLFCFFP